MRLTICISILLLAAGSAQAADTPVIVLPTDAMAGVLNYLSNRPYREVAPIIAGVQRCLQDQLPDDKGAVTAKGACPELTLPLHRLNTPLPHEPPPKE
jgi:hypothetical protein